MARLEVGDLCSYCKKGITELHYSTREIKLGENSSPTIFTGNAYANPPMDSMGMMHFHPQLTLVIDGKSATVPAKIGIDPQLWQDHSLDSYGMQGMAPLHTHDTSGTIHVESFVNRYYTFGQLLDIWGLNFSEYKQVTMTV